MTLKKRPASAAKARSRSPRRTAEKGPPSEICPICLDPCDSGPEAAWLYTCLHRVHKDCADVLIHSKNGRRCPLCRAECRGCDAHGNALPVNEESDEDTDDEDDADDDAREFCEMMMRVVQSAFHKAYGPNRSNGRRRNQSTRELRWFVVLEFLNKARAHLNALHQNDWLSSRVTKGLFLTYLEMLVENYGEVTHNEAGTALNFPGDNVLILPEADEEVSPPNRPESTEEAFRRKTESLLRAAQGDDELEITDDVAA